MIKETTEKRENKKGKKVIKDEDMIFQTYILYYKPSLNVEKLCFLKKGISKCPCEVSIIFNNSSLLYTYPFIYFNNIHDFKRINEMLCVLCTAEI